MIKYYVWRENTLLCKFEHDMFYGVLAGSVLKGGADPKNGVVLPNPDELREATIADFDEYRVSHVGHLT